MPEAVEVLPWTSGYHYYAGEIELLVWLGPAICAFEPGSVAAPHETFHATTTARLLYPIDTWTERTARLFAAGCAEHVRHYFDEVFPDSLVRLYEEVSVEDLVAVSELERTVGGRALPIVNE